MSDTVHVVTRHWRWEGAAVLAVAASLGVGQRIAENDHDGQGFLEWATLVPSDNLGVYAWAGQGSSVDWYKVTQWDVARQPVAVSDAG